MFYVHLILPLFAMSIDYANYTSNPNYNNTPAVAVPVSQKENISYEA
jgi:hypothetical protein